MVPRGVFSIREPSHVDLLIVIIKSPGISRSYYLRKETKLEVKNRDEVHLPFKNKFRTVLNERNGLHL
jgi:hypothetical protein